MQCSAVTSTAFRQIRYVWVRCCKATYRSKHFLMLVAAATAALIKSMAASRRNERQKHACFLHSVHAGCCTASLCNANKKHNYTLCTQVQICPSSRTVAKNISLGGTNRTEHNAHRDTCVCVCVSQNKLDTQKHPTFFGHCGCSVVIIHTGTL